VRRRTSLVVAAVVVAAVVAAMVVLLFWDTGAPAPTSHDSEVRVTGSSGAGPTAGATRRPVVRAGHTTWFAPRAGDEAGLPTVPGLLPEALAVDETYPRLRPGAVERAVLAMGVFGDAAALDRLLVLDESWQVFEVPLAGIARTTAGLGLSRGGLSADGTRLALGGVGTYVVVDLRDLSRARVGVNDTSTRDLSWSHGSVVLGERPAVLREPATSRTVAMVTGGGVPRIRTQGASLVLDGPRPSRCCAVAGWSRRGHVLYESREGARLHILDWDTTTGEVAQVSTIEPVVSNDWYLQTSYAGLAEVAHPRSSGRP
jgi:hypothetical protein